MTTTGGAERDLARRLVDWEESHGPPVGGGAGAAIPAAERVFERLRVQLARSIGAEGFRLLLVRAFDGARTEHPLLARIPPRPEANWPVDELAECLRDADPAAATEALVVLVGALIALLGRFVGNALASRLVEQSWPSGWSGNQTSARRGEASHG